MKFSIDFGSAISANRIEEVNIIDPRARVCHLGLRKDLKKINSNSIGFIGGGSIGNLFEAGPPWVSYDLGNSALIYESALAAMKTAIESDVFRFFDEYSQIENILHYIGRPAFDLRSTIFLYHYLDRSDLLGELMSLVSVGKKQSFVSTCESYSQRFLKGEITNEIYADVKDNDDRLALRIAQTFFEMGEAYIHKKFE